MQQQTVKVSLDEIRDEMRQLRDEIRKLKAGD